MNFKWIFAVVVVVVAVDAMGLNDSTLHVEYLHTRLLLCLSCLTARTLFPFVQVLRACERALLWDEAVYLYKEDGQYDSAVKTMIDHCVCFKHELFLDCVTKVGDPLLLLLPLVSVL